MRSPLVSTGPSLAEERRRMRTARLIAIASVVVVVVLVVAVWAVVAIGRGVIADGSRSGMEPRPRPVLPVGRPAPQLLARALVDGDDQVIRLQAPINRAAVTAIGYDHRDDGEVVQLDPAGERANRSLVGRLADRFLSTGDEAGAAWYQLGSDIANTVVVGAVSGTDVYAPLDGRVVALSDNVIDGVTHGVVVQIQPLGDGEIVVVIRGLDPIPELRFGQTVSAGTTKVGTVRDLAGVAEQPLRQYSNDTGAGVEIYVKRHRLDTGIA